MFRCYIFCNKLLNRQRWLLLLLSSCSFSPVYTPFAYAGDVEERVLSNGLKVIVKEDHRVPIVVSQIWYKIGSSYESNGKTGVSHVLEHMMFKGTPKYPKDSFNKIIAENGGEDNAFTSRDYTAYFQTLEASRLEISFKLEADRMKNLTFSADDFNKEVMVVQEERRWRTDDKPRAKAFEQLYVSAFDNSGYHHPVIGWMDDLKNLQQSDVHQWYQQFYQPANATLVVAGDVESEKVFALAKKHYGKISSTPLAKQKSFQERKQYGTKSIQLQLEAQLPYLTIGYKVPTIMAPDNEKTWEPYALVLLSGLLDGGDSTRLPYKLVKQQQIAASVSCYYSLTARMQTLFVIDAIPSQGKTIKQVEQAIYQEIKLLQDQTVSDEELERVKNQIIASSVFEKDSIFYQAMKIGVAETNGFGWETEEKFVDQIRLITPEQIQAVAKKYLQTQQMTRVEVQAVKS